METLKKHMHLSLITLALFVQAACLAGEPLGEVKKRVEYTGSFVLCGFPHIMHRPCYDRWPKGCPLCTHEIKKPDLEIATDTVYLEQTGSSVLDPDCAICSLDVREAPDRYSSPVLASPATEIPAIVPVTLEPVSSAPDLVVDARLPEVAPVLRRSPEFYDSYATLQKIIAQTKDARKKAQLIVQARRMQAEQFRYPRK